MKKTLIATCPQCNMDVVWSSDNPYRPFCSERCKMIDLGAWASESYRIAKPVDDDTEESGQA